MKTFLNKYSMHVYIFVFYAAVASAMPYLGFWFTGKGLSNQQIGFLFSIGPMVAFFVQPLWGMLCDRFGISKLVLGLCLIMNPTILLGYYFGTEYAAYVATAVLLALFSAAMAPIADALTVSHAERNGQSYGSIRVLGSVSFALAVTPLGLLYRNTGAEALFPIYFVLMIGALSALFLVKPTSVKAKGPLFKGIRRLLSNKDYLLFLFLTFLVALGSQGYNTFFSVFLSRLGGEASGSIGILNTVSALSELPFFLLSGWLIKRFGYFPLLAFASAVAALRWFIMSLEPSFAILTVNQMLHGITMALFLATTVNYAFNASPEETRTTSQTLLALMTYSLSPVVGGNVGGWLVDVGGFALLYRTGAILAFIGALGFLVLNFRSSARRAGVQQNV